MKMTGPIALLSVLILALAGYSPSKPGPKGGAMQSQEYVLDTTQQVDSLLNLLEGNMQQLNMLNHDVVVNVDAIINIEEQNSSIIKAIEAKPHLMSEAQRQRYNTLYEQYKILNGN